MKRRDDGPRQIELKFHLPQGSRTILEKCYVIAAVKPKQHQQITTYFDTSDRVLDRSGLTLHVRRSGNEHIQTVKSRGRGRGLAKDRNEWHWRISKDVPDVAKLEGIQALSTVAQAIRGKLEPVFVTDILRTTRELSLDPETLVETAIDEGSIKTGGASEPVSELELELKRGSIERAYRLAADLQSLVPMWISPESKAARGWHLLTGQTEGGQLAYIPKLAGGPRKGFIRFYLERLVMWWPISARPCVATPKPYIRYGWRSVSLERYCSSSSPTWILLPQDVSKQSCGASHRLSGRRETGMCSALRHFPRRWRIWPTIGWRV